LNAVSDPAAAFTGTVLGMYRRVAVFFNGLVNDVPIRVPAGHYGAVSDDGGSVGRRQPVAQHRIDHLGVDLVGSVCSVWPIELRRDAVIVVP